MNVSCDAALRSLDDLSTLLSQSSEKLRAGTLLDVTQVVEQLKTAAESARTVREAVLSELPDASWQNRDELDALLERVRIISEERAAVQRQRSRLLALAAALESGSIVHRRAQRLAELQQLRGNAINELRSQAALESAPSALPGPEAEEWIPWACALKEPEDAESLQTIRAGFPHLDDFVANLEPSMWMRGSSGATSQLESKHTAAGEHPGEYRRDTDEPGKSLQASSGPQLDSPGPENSAGEHDESHLASNEFFAPIRSKPQPLQESRPIPLEERERIQERERIVLAKLMGMGTGDPAGDQGPEQATSGTALVCATTTQTAVAPQSESSRSLSASPMLAVLPEVEESANSQTENGQWEQKQVEPAPSLSAEWLAKFGTEAESPFPYELYGLSVAAGLTTPEAAEGDRTASEEELERSQERALARLAGIDADRRERDQTSAHVSGASAPHKIGAASAVDYDIHSADQRPWTGRWAILLVAVLALLLTAGFLIWRGSRKTPTNRPPDAVQRALPAPAQSSSTEVKGPTHAASTTSHEVQAAAPITRTQPEPKQQDRSVPRAADTKVRGPKPAGEQQVAVLSPPPATPRHIRKEEAAPAPEAGTLSPVAGSSINGVPKGLANALTNVPVVVPKVSEQKDKATPELEPAVLLRQVPPRYPQQAREARIEGTVVLEGVIGTDGKLQNLRVVRGDPRLTQAALDAAKQWRYKPGRIHGQPVESDTQINVNFSLKGG